ncbi:hypothetical protein EYF80_041730 [Liparis tanakae]|uniref:Uncharacterized protein n=1 Tax=Liparis tanakae TaxID=230148 RepID=A0A4Z2G5A3_9TELE|nr:hypothetical protein EYF80_041730 [Liparis tanakae]
MDLIGFAIGDGVSLPSITTPQTCQTNLPRLKVTPGEHAADRRNQSPERTVSPEAEGLRKTSVRMSCTCMSRLSCGSLHTEQRGGRGGYVTNTPPRSAARGGRDVNGRRMNTPGSLRRHVHTEAYDVCGDIEPTLRRSPQPPLCGSKGVTAPGKKAVVLSRQSAGATQETCPTTGYKV